MSLIVKTALVWIQVEDVMVLEIAKSVEKTRSIVVRTFYFVFIWSYKGAHSNSRIILMGIINEHLWTYAGSTFFVILPEVLQRLLLSQGSCCSLQNRD